MCLCKNKEPQRTNVFLQPSMTSQRSFPRLSSTPSCACGSACLLRRNRPNLGCHHFLQNNFQEPCFLGAHAAQSWACSLLMPDLQVLFIRSPRRLPWNQRSYLDTEERELPPPWFTLEWRQAKRSVYATREQTPREKVLPLTQSSTVEGLRSQDENELKREVTKWQANLIMRGSI